MPQSGHPSEIMKDSQLKPAFLFRHRSSQFAIWKGLRGWWGRQRARRSSVSGRELFIENLLVIIEMIWWTGLAPWEFEYPFSCSFTSTVLAVEARVPVQAPVVPIRHLERSARVVGASQGYLADKKPPPPLGLP